MFNKIIHFRITFIQILCNLLNVQFKSTSMAPSGEPGSLNLTISIMPTTTMKTQYDKKEDDHIN